jgi:hypothetical protein
MGCSLCTSRLIIIARVLGGRLDEVHAATEALAATTSAEELNGAGPGSLVRHLLAGSHVIMKKGEAVAPTTSNMSTAHRP